MTLTRLFTSLPCYSTSGVILVVEDTVVYEVIVERPTPDESNMTPGSKDKERDC